VTSFLELMVGSMLFGLMFGMLRCCVYQSVMVLWRLGVFLCLGVVWRVGCFA